MTWHDFCLMFCVMNNETNRIRKTGMKKGAALIEYTVVLCGLAVALILLANGMFYSVDRGFGPLGQSIVAFFQRLQGGLSLPIP